MGRADGAGVGPGVAAWGALARRPWAPPWGGGARPSRREGSEFGVRDNLRADLVGRRVEWDIPVYEVSFSEGRYEVTSQPIPIRDRNAAPLILVKAFVAPQREADDASLQAVKTGDVIRVRGIVQEIRLRTIVAVVPAILVSASVDSNELPQVQK